MSNERRLHRAALLHRKARSIQDWASTSTYASWMETSMHNIRGARIALLFVLLLGVAICQTLCSTALKQASVASSSHSMLAHSDNTTWGLGDGRRALLQDDDPCTQYDSCSPCLENTPQCRWCYRGGNPDYPQCQSSRASCGSWYGSGPDECPRDGGNTKASISCADISTCDNCLRFAGEGGGQCRWCLSGDKPRCMQNVGCDNEDCDSCTSWWGSRPDECPQEDPCTQIQNCAPCLERSSECRWCLGGGATFDYPHCQAIGTKCSSGWFGSGPQECPADGGNTKSSFKCTDITSCNNCLRYAGEGGQCRWCLTGQQHCMQNIGCDRYCGSCSSWYGYRQQECPFAAKIYNSVCKGRGKPCVEYTVRAGDTPARIAAMYGTNTWQLLSDNPLPRSAKGARGSLKTGDVLAVRPAPGAELVKWLWPSTEAALLLGSPKFPRPCAGYPTMAQRQDCFCHYLPDGAYIWPFSSTARKCRQFINCVGGKPEMDYDFTWDGRFLYDCPDGTVAHVDLDFNGECVDMPSNFQCSDGDGCNNMFCFCEEFLLKPGAYLNPFDSTRTTALVCDWTQPGWFGGLIYCPAGAFFDPIARVCTGVSQAHRPYRKGFTTCDGVPDPDATMPRAGGRRLVGTSLWITPTAQPPCTQTSCCTAKLLTAAKKYQCLPCRSCKGGQHHLHPVAGKQGCQCLVLGACPVFFNRNCRWKRP